MKQEYSEDDFKRVCEWLKEHSSGSYHTSAEAAHMIQHLCEKIQTLEAAASTAAKTAESDPVNCAGRSANSAHDNWARFLGDNIEKCLSTGNHGFFISVPQGRSLMSLIDGIH